MFIFTNIVTDLSDNHYLQVCTNLKTTYELAQHKMEGYKENFLSWVERFNTKDIASVELDGSWVPQYDTDTQQKLEEVKNQNLKHIWTEVYNETNLGVSYHEALGK